MINCQSLRGINAMKSAKIHIKTIIDVIVGAVFFILILVTLSCVTFSHIDNARLKVVIQKKDVHIQALITACRMDYLIRVRRPDFNDYK